MSERVAIVAGTGGELGRATAGKLAAAGFTAARVAAEAGPPEVLVNTIGMFHPGDALTATPEDLRLMIDVNVGGAVADPGGRPLPAGPRFGFRRARGRPHGPGADRGGLPPPSARPR